MSNPSTDKDPVSPLSRQWKSEEGDHGRKPSDLELMKERFAKLLLGEDMSGGGKGVSSALALSNTITNLAASVFGEQKRLEPMDADRKARWRKEIDWLLSVTNYIVELVPSQQKNKDGFNIEVMVTQQRKDLLVNVPGLCKLDTMLIDCLDNFKEQKEFWYISRDADDSENVSQRDKWWLPIVKVPQGGLTNATRKWLQVQKDSVNQVLKASMAINAQILSEMEIPDNYIESLPKNGRSTLGESIYKGITDEFFDPEDFFLNMDLSTEHKVLDLKNRIEASVVIWKRKMHHKDGKSSWGSKVSMEKRELFEERAEMILLLLKQRFPGISQSSLDISKIQYNRDVGHAILESYSRVVESLASTVMSRIEDVLYADSTAKDSSAAACKWKTSVASSPLKGQEGPPSPVEDTQSNTEVTPTSRTLSDFMGWNLDDKKESLDFSKDEKPANVVIDKKLTYTDKLDALGGLSPARY